MKFILSKYSNDSPESFKIVQIATLDRHMEDLIFLQCQLSYISSFES